MKIAELISIVFSTLVSGMFWGPWLAVSRTMPKFSPDVFLVLVSQMNRNMASLMTFLMPISLLSLVPVLILSYNERPQTFVLTLIALGFFIVALLVTMLVEVPIVTQIATWTVATLPANWQQRRDRWGAFHIVRIVSSIVGLILLLAGAIL